MDIRVLGCSGGIGGSQRRTTALAVDSDILIDCGTGVGELSFEALSRIDHIFLTHSHFDHLALLPMLIDSVAEQRTQPISVYALPETLTALRQHVFNWVLWPDFTVLPHTDRPVLRLHPVQPGQTVSLGARHVTALPAEHSVPAVGYALAQDGGGSLAFSGDTTLCPPLQDALNAQSDLRYLLIETAFPEDMRQKAEISRHLCPSLLGTFLSGLKCHPEIFITHLKPACELRACKDIVLIADHRVPQMLNIGQTFHL